MAIFLHFFLSFFLSFFLGLLVCSLVLDLSERFRYLLNKSINQVGKVKATLD